MLLERLWNWLWGHKLTYALTLALWLAVCWAAAPWLLPWFGQVSPSPVVFWAMLPAFFAFSSVGAYYTDKLDRSKLHPDIKQQVYELRVLCRSYRDQGDITDHIQAIARALEIRKFQNCCEDSRMMGSWCKLHVASDLLCEELGKGTEGDGIRYLNRIMLEGAEQFIRDSDWAAKQ